MKVLWNGCHVSARLDVDKVNVKCGLRPEGHQFYKTDVMSASPEFSFRNSPGGRRGVTRAPVIKMKILWGKKAVLLEQGTLVVGDLHIGLEKSFRAKGVRLPSNTQTMLSELIDLIKKTRAKKIVLLGDIKHNVAVVSSQEAREIPLFFHELSKHAEVIVVLGNHDGSIKEFLRGFDVYPSSGVLIGDKLLIHGNAKPNPDFLEKASMIIASHWHLNFRFQTKVTERVWVEASVSEKPLLIIPPFNDLVGGVEVKDVHGGWVDLSDAKVWLTDGVRIK